MRGMTTDLPSVLSPSTPSIKSGNSTFGVQLLSSCCYALKPRTYFPSEVETDEWEPDKEHFIYLKTENFRLQCNPK